MDNNIKVSITAEIIDAQAKLAIMSAESRTLETNLRNLAKAAASTGMTSVLTPELLKAAEAAVIAKTEMAAFKAETAATAPAVAGDMDLMAGATRALESAIAPLAAAFSVMAVVGFGESAEKSAAGIQHMSNVLGIGVEDLQAYHFAAQESGVSLDESDTALRRFLANMGALQEGTGPAVKAIEKLGLTADELAGDPMQALVLIAQKLDGITDATKRADIERELFGRGGQDLNAMLGQLAQGMDKMKEKTRAAGEMLDPQLTEAAEKANIKFDEAATKLMDMLSPAAVAATEHLSALMKVFADLPGAISAAEDAWDESAFVGDKLHGRGLDWNSVKGGKGAPAMPKPWADIPKQIPVPTNDVPPPVLEKPGAGNKAAAAAKRESEQIIAIHKQTNDAIIQGEVQRNASELALGRESLAQFTAQELTFAKAKYDADLQALQQQEAVGKITHAEYLASKGLLDQQYQNKKDQIAEQSAQKQRQLDDKQLADTVKTQDEQLKAVEDANARKFKSGEISAADKAALDIQAVDTAQKNVDDEFIKLTTGWDHENAAYKAMLDLRDAYARQSADKRRSIEDKAVADETASYTKMLGPFNSMLQSMMTGTQRWSQMFASLMQKLAMTFVQYVEKMVVDWVVSEQVKTAATEAGNTMRTGSNFFAASASSAAEVSAGSKSIMNDAYESAAHAYKSVMASVPAPANLIAAPIAAAGVFAVVMAFDALQSFDKGTMNVSHDQLAQVHAGEIIIPADLASHWRMSGLAMSSPAFEMRDMGSPFSGSNAIGANISSVSNTINNSGGGQSGGGGAFHYHAPRVQALDQTGFDRVLRNNMSAMMKFANNYQRNQPR